MQTLAEESWEMDAHPHRCFSSFSSRLYMGNMQYSSMQAALE